MRILNVHERAYAAPPAELGALLDTLGSRADRLWPRRDWPPMILPDGLVAGSAGGHGPIRYVVERHVPGRAAVFRFTRPRGWTGTHAFTVDPLPGGRSRLRHTLEMDAGGTGLFLWAAVFRPLHDAVLEDALDRAAVALGLAPPAPPAWSSYVRLLRRVLRPRRARPRLERVSPAPEESRPPPDR